MTEANHIPEGSIVLPPAGGRTYEMGPMTAVFKADEDETRQRYSVSEWWLEPHSDGPGAHQHEANDEVFYSIAGSPSVLVGDTWHDAPVGTFFMIPAGTMHDFANRTGERAALLNFWIPGGFERNMPAIVEWFRKNR